MEHVNCPYARLVEKARHMNCEQWKLVGAGLTGNVVRLDSELNFERVKNLKLGLSVNSEHLNCELVTLVE